MNLLSLLPQQKETTPETVIREARTTFSTPLVPGSDEAKRYCAELSRLLLANSEARKYPELQALGFWLRPASVDNMVKCYLKSSNCTAAGIIFQLPPSNVATLFGYTSAIALLCGNTVIIRLPSVENPVQSLLLSLMKESLAKTAHALQERLIVLRYGHDDVVTSALSRISASRLVWGSDETVEHIASLPLPADSRHVSFGDRYSAMALDANAYIKLVENDRDKLLKNIFNDIYTFDQLACSSPRLLIWIGDDKAAIAAAADLYPRLAAYAEKRGYVIGAGESIAKQNAGFLSLHDLTAASYKTYGSQLSVITLENLEHLSSFKPVNCGYGILLATRMDKLVALAPWTEPRDQTLSCWGIDESEIRKFLAAKERRGFDRIVATGQALTFDPVWDGCNLFEAMTHATGGKA